MNLLHTLRKLRKMPLSEISDRLVVRLVTEADRLRFRLQTEAAPRTPLTPSVGERIAAQKLLARAVRFLGGAQGPSWQSLATIAPELRARIEQEAIAQGEAILAGKLVLFGRSVQLPTDEGWDWRRDPCGTYEWPQAFHADVPLYDLPGETDVKTVWELGRMKWLVTLAKAWFVTRDERFAARALALWLDWIDANPPTAGVHWTSGLEVATRAIASIWALALLSTWEKWSEADLVRITRFLGEHAAYLDKYPSHHASPYNHLIGEATALFLVGRTVAELPSAARWMERGREWLEAAAPAQFHSDGCNVEQAASYHYYTLGFLLQAIHAERVVDGDWPALAEVCAHAFPRMRAMADGHGHWPAIGDTDAARSFPLEVHDFWDFRGLYPAAASVLQAPGLKAADDAPSAELYWLGGADAVREWQAWPTTEAPRIAVFATAGYACGGTSEVGGIDRLLFEAGPLSAGVHADETPSVAHGHDDGLQVLVHQDGEPLLVDSGMPTYAGSRAWLDHFRTAGAHNTFRIEGAELATVAGRLGWSQVAEPTEFAANLSRAVWLTLGTFKPQPGVELTRAVLAIPGEAVWIADYAESPVAATVSWYWQFAAERLPELATLAESNIGGELVPSSGERGAAATPRSRSRHDFGRAASQASHAGQSPIATPSPNNALGYAIRQFAIAPLSGSAAQRSIDYRGGRMDVWGSASFTIEVDEATAASPVAWQSHGYGERHPARRVVVRSTAKGPLLFVTRLGAGSTGAAVSLRGLSLICGFQYEAAAALPIVADDQVAWQCETAGGPKTIVAGMTIVANDHCQPLYGSGGWPAYVVE